MRRRTLVRSVLACAAVLPLPGIRSWASSRSFPGTQEEVLRRLAATVLPSELGRNATENVADRFAEWVRDYREGVERSPGYGAPTIRYTGPSPANRYREQLEGLGRGALAGATPETRRREVAALLDRLGLAELPGSPRGEHVVVDLLSFYFESAGAHDLAYEAAIAKDACRGLAGSGEAPRPLGRG
jgi:hypothetical protein